MTTPDRLPLTPAERAALRQKAELASPGPWEARDDGEGQSTVWHPKGAWLAESSSINGAYIAAISPDRLLALLDEVERLEATNDRLMVELSILDRDDEVLKVQP